MERDGLTSNPTLLGEATKAAIAFVVGHTRPHADALKVQTSHGNYLSDPQGGDMARRALG